MREIKLNREGFFSIKMPPQFVEETQVIRRLAFFALVAGQLVLALRSTSGQSRPDALTPAEKVVVDTPTPDRARRWLAQLTEEPHVAGTEAEKRVAEYVLARFKEFKLEAEISRLDVFLNNHKRVSLKLVS